MGDGCRFQPLIFQGVSILGVLCFTEMPTQLRNLSLAPHGFKRFWIPSKAWPIFILNVLNGNIWSQKKSPSTNKDNQQPKVLEGPFASSLEVCASRSIFVEVQPLFNNNLSAKMQKSLSNSLLVLGKASICRPVFAKPGSCGSLHQKLWDASFFPLLF